MANPKGRASQSTHPGFTIKGVLMGQIPLRTGGFVTQASINDIHNAYQELIRQENMLRPKFPKGRRYKRLRGMGSTSFYALFRLARYLELVEFVREEPLLHPPPHGHLYSTRKNTRTGKMNAVISTRHIYKLTETGKDAEQSWQNLHKAWKYHLSRLPSE